MRATLRRAALHARISRDDRDVETTAAQIRRCPDLACRQAYEVVAENADDGISGFHDRAGPAWVELGHGTQSRSIDLILAVAEDRFTRGAEARIGFQVACARAVVKWRTIGGGLARRLRHSEHRSNYMTTADGLNNVHKIEPTTLAWVWFRNNQRRRGELGMRIPTEVEDAHYADQRSAPCDCLGQEHR